ncbi:hypothetical protein NE865_00225 [Phthorimaea operculella]|nr:hypothetical protein NE865_00225 [Phthorimaea operculella]
MAAESSALLNQLRFKDEFQKNATGLNVYLDTPEGVRLNVYLDTPEGVRVRLRALLVALLGVSMSVCAFASQPVELELDDDEVSQKLNNVSLVRRITKPTIRLIMGYGKFSAIVTAFTSLLLLMAVMSKQAWWRRGARWLAAPALLVAALEVASDTGDALIAAVLRGSAEPARIVWQTAAAAVLVTVEILVWYDAFSCV